MSRFVSNAGQQVADIAERAAEPGRLSRGRTLFRKGSVSDLTIIEGSVIASVRGSGGGEYETSVGTALAPPWVIRQIAQAYAPGDRWSLDDLIGNGLDLCPRDVDLAFSCDCADWDELCKHVVAVLLALADRVDLDEAELLRWRGVELGEAADDGVDEAADELADELAAEDRSPSGSAPSPATRAGETPGRRVGPDDHRPAAASEDRTARLSELEALLGDTVLRVPPSDTADGLQPEPEAPPLEPAMAAFLGVDLAIAPIDIETVTTPPPLFADVQLGPLADLGPALAEALAIIAARLDATQG